MPFLLSIIELTFEKQLFSFINYVKQLHII